MSTNAYTSKHITAMREAMAGIIPAEDPREQAKDRLNPSEAAKVTLYRSVRAADDLGMTWKMPSVKAAQCCPHVRYLELRGLIHLNGRTLRIAR